MSVSLCMIVYNAEPTVMQSIISAMPYCDEIVVVDTGSNDGTQSLIEDQLGLKVHQYPHEFKPEEGLLKVRNYSLGLVKTDWALVLDSDENILRFPKNIKDVIKDSSVSGCFGTWKNTRNGKAYDDYKMFLVRTAYGIKFSGVVHAAPQAVVREKKQQGEYLDELIVYHNQVNRRYRSHYLQQMYNAVTSSPEYIRYHWFLGYTLLQQGVKEGVFWLQEAAFSKTNIFPVEKLNAALCLSSHYCNLGHVNEANYLLDEVEAYHRANNTDFEVRINHYPSWIAQVRKALKERSTIKMRDFAC